MFLTDVVILLSVLALVARNGLRFRRPKFSYLLLVTTLLFAFAVARLAAGGSISRDALRDFAPYGYAIVAIVIVLSREELPAWFSKGMFGALLFHTGWLTTIKLIPTIYDHTPTLYTVPVFAERPDFDSTVCGITSSLCIYLLRVRRPDWATSLLLASIGWLNLTLVAVMPSRAGLLATVAALALSLAVPLHQKKKHWRDPRVWVAVVVPIIAVIPLVGYSDPGQRLIDSLHGQGEAAGTTNARIVSWDATIDYILDTDTRTALGVGFGPDFLHESGADKYLEGTVYDGVRSPHNYWLGTWARMGLVGLALVLILQVLGSWLAFRTLWRPRRPCTVLDFTAGLLLLTIPIIAALGVVLESPFGAVPYFWGIGYLMRTHQDAPRRARRSEWPENLNQRSTRTRRPASSSSSA